MNKWTWLENSSIEKKEKEKFSSVLTFISFREKVYIPAYISFKKNQTKENGIHMILQDVFSFYIDTWTYIYKYVHVYIIILYSIFYI